jgi:hypothetical protein
VFCNLLKGTGGPHRRARPLRPCGRRRAAPCARIQPDPSNRNVVPRRRLGVYYCRSMTWQIALLKR